MDNEPYCGKCDMYHRGPCGRLPVERGGIVNQIEAGDVVRWTHPTDSDCTLLIVVGEVRADGDEFRSESGRAWWPIWSAKLVAKSTAPLLKRIEELETEREKFLDCIESMMSQHYQVEQTTADGKPMFHHMFMSDGEEAVDILLDAGRITIEQCQVL